MTHPQDHLITESRGTCHHPYITDEIVGPERRSHSSESPATKEASLACSSLADEPPHFFPPSSSYRKAEAHPLSGSGCHLRLIQKGPWEGKNNWTGRRWGTAICHSGDRNVSSSCGCLKPQLALCHSTDPSSLPVTHIAHVLRDTALGEVGGLTSFQFNGPT